MSAGRFEPIYDKGDEEIGAPWRAVLETDAYGDVFLSARFPDKASCQEFIDTVQAALGVHGGQG